MPALGQYRQKLGATVSKMQGAHPVYSGPQAGGAGVRPGPVHLVIGRVLGKVFSCSGIALCGDLGLGDIEWPW